MARITVEDCLEKIDSQYDLVMLAKERTSQLNAGDPLLVPQENDKHTVVALREIAEGKVSVKTLEDLGIEKLRKNQREDNEELEDAAEATEDDFDKIYKGEVSKSGTAILPSKRSKRMPIDKNKIDEIKLDENNEEKDTSLTEEKKKDIKISEENKTE
tara:strand:+ start:1210 stop:1683 length:474 start_codon:yes stop_codon:yes gene_type:complete